MPERLWLVSDAVIEWSGVGAVAKINQFLINQQDLDVKLVVYQHRMI